MDLIPHHESEKFGLTLRQVRGRSFAHPVAGVAVPLTEADDLATRTRAALEVMPPGTVATHLTAAALREWWLPPLDEVPVIVCTDSDAPHHDRRGVYVRRCALPERNRTHLDGIAIASAEWTIIELAETLAFIDLVVAIDSALRHEHTTVDLIRAALVPGRRGVRNLRKALMVCDGRSESAGESALRLVHTLSGIPVDVQPEICDERGVVIARLDLRVRGTNYAPEYDGAGHRDAPTHRKDLRRDRLLPTVNVRRAGFTMFEIRTQADQIVREAARALGRPFAFTASDVRPLIDQSSITHAGMELLATRLQRFRRPEPPRRS